MSVATSRPSVNSARNIFQRYAEEKAAKYEVLVLAGSKTTVEQAKVAYECDSWDGASAFLRTYLADDIQEGKSFGLIAVRVAGQEMVELGEVIPANV